jgi:hypothetical protein
MIDIRNEFKEDILQLYLNSISDILNYSYFKIKQEVCSYLNSEILKHTRVEDKISYNLYKFLENPIYEKPKKLKDEFSIKFEWEPKLISKGEPDFEILIFLEGDIKTYSFIEAKFLKNDTNSCSNYVKEGMLRFNDKYYEIPFGIGFMFGYLTEKNKIEEIKSCVENNRNSFIKTTFEKINKDLGIKIFCSKHNGKLKFYHIFFDFSN